MRFTSILAALTLTTTLACTLDGATDPVRITGADVNAVAAGDSYLVDVDHGADIVLDSRVSPINFHRVTLVAHDVSVPMSELLPSMRDDYGAALDQALASELVLRTTPRTEAVADGVIAFKRLHCSSDGKLCLLCDYSDRDGRLEGCDVYAPTPRRAY